jgi:hypothetical protein
MAPSRASNALLHIVCRGTLRVALPPVPALRFFTPEGERACPPGWDPAYPASPEDDTALSTVSVTHANGYDTVWVVVERSEPSMRHTHLAPDVQAGTVHVECLLDGQATRAENTYDLTAAHFDPLATGGFQTRRSQTACAANAFAGSASTATSRTGSAMTVWNVELAGTLARCDHLLLAESACMAVLPRLRCALSRGRSRVRAGVCASGAGTGR